MHLRFLIAAAVAAMLMSCATQRQIVYFQDAENGTVERIERADDIRLRPSDQIAIVVNSKDQQLAEMFNLPLVPHYLSGAILNTADRIMIEKMVGASAAGIYSLAYSVSLIMIGFTLCGAKIGILFLISQKGF